MTPEESAKLQDRVLDQYETVHTLVTNAITACNGTTEFIQADICVASIENLFLELLKSVKEETAKEVSGKCLVMAAATIPTLDGVRNLGWDEIVHDILREYPDVATR